MKSSIDHAGYLSPNVPIGEGASIEARAVEAYFRSKRARDISINELARDYHDPAACLVFMSNEAFAFFLPAFMRIALEDYAISGAIPEAVVGRLLAMAEGRDNERRDAVLRTYSKDELASVAKFLKEISARYWHKYPEDTAMRAYEYWDGIASGRS